MENQNSTTGAPDLESVPLVLRLVTAAAEFLLTVAGRPRSGIGMCLVPSKCWDVTRSRLRLSPTDAGARGCFWMPVRGDQPPAWLPSQIFVKIAFAIKGHLHFIAPPVPPEIAPPYHG